ncbi:glycosyltransferase family 4 protein [Kineothrix sp. MB12-C1]|uniref:glycosyltransferase family 4 protein n=1 Tax=Kineothrix sp. MB12-C1 TaxID=3070215 RepID=UPI0027D20381|nr:glycosyltransferase family 4 protein [Kineothrix sp. MB12-C1]WMC91689.1 glycosyltransferase family 4 protein [Kineothrix sp. MB12-C1]
MYIAPRYHTNQTAIMKGFVENGHKVRFLSHYRGKIEDYTYTEPVIVGYSPVFHLFEKIYISLHRKNPQAADIKLKTGFPSIWKLNNYMKDFKPDIVILRERSVYSIVAYLICCIRKYPSILYNQSPLWEKEIKNDFLHKLVRLFSPKVRITPVYGDEKKNHAKEYNAYFVPFVMESKLSPEERTYFRREKINVLAIGKYEERKNHKMLIDIFAKLSERYDLTLTLIGECSTVYHEEYYAELEKIILDKKLEDKVRTLKNLSREQVESEYQNADLFIIPSTREPASISQLEAMAFSLPVICSDTNGTACYVEDGINGYHFQDNNAADLEEKIEAIISDKKKLQYMGRGSYRMIKEKYGFHRYYRSIVEIMEKEL